MSTEIKCTCPSGDGSLRWPCPAHPPRMGQLHQHLLDVLGAKDHVDAGRIIGEMQGAGFDRARETPRRQSAVELLLSLGYVWATDHWEAPKPDAGSGGDAPIDVTDPWRGLYRAERLRANGDGDGDGDLYHPDLPSWPDDSEDALDKLVHAQGFDFHVVAGEFSNEAMEDGDELYWQEMRAWNPQAPEGDWRLAWKGDTEDGPYAWFVRPMALRPEPEAIAELPTPAAVPVDGTYSLDADPAGIRSRVADCIAGTMMVGAQDHTPPPADHWLEPFWNMARADAAVPVDVLRDADEALELLDYMFSSWEDGDPCTDNGDNDGDFLGNAFRIGDEEHSRIADLLNRRRPRESVLATHPQPAAAIASIGVAAIAEERARQVQVEGMTPEGDAGYRYGQLTWAAVAYAQLAAMDLQGGGREQIATASPPACWPWGSSWWKPRDVRRDLVRAGALIAAQLDAIDQQAKPEVQR
ncbi:hypothetical protein KWH02_19120 [Xanthomonas campestris pv. uppalii]|uniref:hypothetical protein n=1 Tax=Xanthomonas euvesicatoria TaxID=456327 RepID=UPI001C4703EE|nr:hypothetical protein [Xanthomonas euvesicatoria]MBV6787257.1 hypothetical protein [Xanthomonas campestris pv. uppalii]